MNENKFYITTSIAYTNAKPHIGYALELVQADTLARYWRSKLGKDNTYFLTGTDDHGIKIHETAQKKGIDTKKFVNDNIKGFKDLAKKLTISNNDFISTSDQKKHWDGAKKMWKLLDKSGDIYKKEYEGLYCVGCEAYLTKRDLVDGKCPNHDKKPELVREENYFFKLTKYKDRIKDFIKKDTIKIVPEERKNELLNILEEMEDVSFSRPSNKLPWGIPVPGDSSQTMYVWCDALTNYISALGFGKEKHDKLDKFWPADVHVIGKDILKFHAIYWPAMLISAGLTLPKEIFVHGWITSGGKKMSKTLGNVIDPIEVIEKYGEDALRYYLLREIPATGDGDFTWERFEEVYNGELANELGNLVNRVVKMSGKYSIKFKVKSEYFKENGNLLKLENFDFKGAIEDVWTEVRALNEFIEKNKPWELAKDDEKKLEAVLTEAQNKLYEIAFGLAIFMPETAEKIKRQLDTLKAEPLFPRIEK